jgi:hypothetical protein
LPQLINPSVFRQFNDTTHKQPASKADYDG